MSRLADTPAGDIQPHRAVMYRAGQTSRPTLDKVAARAGVSRATASRVVNGSAHVTAHARAAVQRAVDELGYVPNPAARSLVTHRTGAIALVLSEPPGRIYSDDPFFSRLIRGVSQELKAARERLVLILAEPRLSVARVAQDVAAGHVDGVLVASTCGADPLPAGLARHGVPVVCSGRPLTDLGLAYVDVDNAGGAASAVAHLIGRGRRRIATITGPQDTTAGIDRLTGYRQALRRGPYRPVIAGGDYTRASGSRAMDQILDDDPTVDAVFAASDAMAIGALRALRRAGRRVPDDVAVVGFDDIDATHDTEPPLTTVRQPTIELGRRMVRTLLRLTAGEAVDSPVVLPTELVVREST